MEKQLQSVLSRKKTTKLSNKFKQKNSNQAVKVVYISNPMKIKTCASKFRALVQELTGQDADPAKFVEHNQDDGVCGGSSTQTTVVDDVMKNSSSLLNENDSQGASPEEEEYSTIIAGDVLSGSIRSDLDFQAAFVDDDVFKPQTMMMMMMNMDNFSIDSVVPPSNFELYETSSGHEQMMF